MDRREHVLEIAGRRICVCEWGPAAETPIIFVHGALDQSLAWQKVGQMLAELGRRVSAPDLRGHGLSDHDPCAQGYSLLGYVADLAGLVEQLATEPVTLVGHSLGSLVSVIYASTHPGRVRRLVLVETMLPAGVDELDMQQALRQDVEHMRADHRHTPMENLELAIKLLRYTNPGLAPELAGEMCQRVTRRVPEGLVWRWDPILRTQLGWRFPGRQQQYLELLRKTEVPVELLFSQHSRFNSEEDAQRLTSAFPNARRSDVAGGHNLHLDNPHAIVRAVIRAEAETTAASARE
jgi:pimeloyl-ACP methyl ester carboxylesterase